MDMLAALMLSAIWFIIVVWCAVTVSRSANRQLEDKAARAWICPTRADATEIVPREDSGCCEHCPPFHCCSHDVYDFSPSLPEQHEAIRAWNVIDHETGNCRCGGLWLREECQRTHLWCHCGLPRDHGGLCKTASGAYLTERAWNTAVKEPIKRGWDKIAHDWRPDCTCGDGLFTHYMNNGCNR